MRTPKYPLELALKLREKEVDAAARALSVASSERETAERRRAGAERRSKAHAETAQGVRSAEREALSRGGLAVTDLSRAAAWELGVAQEGVALASELSQAIAGEESARAAEGRAQERVASRRVESQLVANHRARWRDDERRRIETKEEEDSEEVWRCRANKTES